MYQVSLILVSTVGRSSGKESIELAWVWFDQIKNGHQEDEE